MVSAGFEPGFRGGGPIRSVASLVDNYTGFRQIVVVTRDRDLGERSPYPGLAGQRVRRGAGRWVFYGNPANPHHWLTLGRALSGARIDALYLNSFFSPTFSLLPQLMARLRILRVGHIVVAPRGELMHGALVLKSFKKQVLLRVWRRLLARGVTLHATSAVESSQILEVLPRATVITVEPASPSEVPETVPSAGGPLRACFVGRISPKKNVHTALAALGRVTGSVVFEIYGPIEDVGYWRECQHLIARLPSNVEVVHRGPLPHEQVAGVFGAADVFVFPTRGENFGHVVAESLRMSCPVLLGADTPWGPVIQGGGGWLVDPDDVSRVAQTLNSLAALRSDDRTKLKRSARAAYERHLEGSPGRSVLDAIESNIDG